MANKIIPGEFTCPRHGSPATLTSGGYSGYVIGCAGNEHELTDAEIAAVAVDAGRSPPARADRRRGDQRGVRRGAEVVFVMAERAQIDALIGGVPTVLHGTVDRTPLPTRAPQSVITFDADTPTLGDGDSFTITTVTVIEDAGGAA